MKSKRTSPLIVSLGVLFYALLSISIGCGLDWNVPQNHFDGVNEQGKLFYWEQIGDLELSDGLNIPLTMGFSSGRTSSSPYLGKGWILPLLESNLVQINSKLFLATLPDGVKIRFWRAKETDTTLTGQADGWMAELGDNSTTLWAECGWKIVYSNGRIASITTPQNQKLIYNYKGGVATDLDLDGKPILNAIMDDSGNVFGISFNNKRISFAKSQKPNVESINGQKVIGEIDSSLNRVTFDDGTADIFNFAVDSALNPTLTVSGNHDRSFSWDPLTQLILKDGAWSYNIISGVGMFDNAQITRKNSQGQSEFWYHDKKAGEEITQELDGTKKITKAFVSGVLRGKIRSIEEIRGKDTTTTYSAAYNETGGLIRETLLEDGHKVIRSYDDLGRMLEVWSDAKKVASFQYDPDTGLLAFREDSYGNKWLYKYNSENLPNITKVVSGEN